MSQRRARKTIRTASLLKHDAQEIQQLVDALLASAEAMKTSRISEIEFDGASKLERGVDLLKQYIVRIDQKILEVRRLG